MRKQEIKVNALGTNEAIKFNFDKSLLGLNGFRFMPKRDNSPIPAHWYYVKYYTYKSLEVSFNITYYVEPYKGTQLQIDVLDEDFCQPYDYQSMLEKNPKSTSEYALKVQDFVEKEIDKLQKAGILSGHERGDYI